MTALDVILSEHPTWRLLSKDKLIKCLKGKCIEFDKAEINKHYANSEIHQIYRQRPSRPEYFRVTGRIGSFMIDVVHMAEFSEGTTAAAAAAAADKFLFIINIPSRKAYAYLLPSATMEQVCKRYEEFILAEKAVFRPVSAVMGDNFFENPAFKTLSEAHHIQVQTVVAKEIHAMRYGSALGVLDRAVKSVKILLKKQISASDDHRWQPHLESIIKLYNETPHSSLSGKSPADAFEDIPFLRSLIKRDKRHNYELKERLNSAFKVGDTVRVALPVSTFAKERAPFSRTLYTIVGQQGYGFRLTDEAGKAVEKTYLAREIMKVNAPTARLADRQVKAVQKKRDTIKALVNKEGIHRRASDAVSGIEKARKAPKTVAESLVKAKKAIGGARPPPAAPWYVVHRSASAVGAAVAGAGEKRTLRDRAAIHPPQWWLQKKK